MLKEIRKRIAISVVGGMGATSLGLSILAANHEADAGKTHFKAAAGIVRQINNASPPVAKETIQSKLHTAYTHLDSAQADRTLTTALHDEIRAITLQEGQWTAIKKARQDIMAGQTAYNDSNNFAVASAVSFTSVYVTGVMAIGALRNRKRKKY